MKSLWRWAPIQVISIRFEKVTSIFLKISITILLTIHNYVYCLLFIVCGVFLAKHEECMPRERESAMPIAAPHTEPFLYGCLLFLFCSCFLFTIALSIDHRHFAISSTLHCGSNKNFLSTFHINWEWTRKRDRLENELRTILMANMSIEVSDRLSEPECKQTVAFILTWTIWREKPSNFFFYLLQLQEYTTSFTQTLEIFFLCMANMHNRSKFILSAECIATAGNKQSLLNPTCLESKLLVQTKRWDID